MTIALINLRYPYGGRQIFLNHSLVSVAARVLSAKPTVKIKFIDFNFDEYQTILLNYEKVGISLLGAPYIPAAVELVRRIIKDFPEKSLAIGGQVVEYISRPAFIAMFQNLPIRQIVNDDDFADWLGEDTKNIPNPLEVSCIPAWEQLESERLAVYLKHEMTLEVSQGCIFKCKFCAARKQQREQLKNLTVFEMDLRFLAEKAKNLGFKTLRFYASALDFFQNSTQKISVLEILKKVRQETGIDIQVRCLTCMSSFLAAASLIPNFQQLLKDAGLYCIGFGVDGIEDSWQREGKGHNKAPQVRQCVELCHRLGIKTELLMVFGFPEDSFATLWKTFKTCIRWGLKPGVILRPYMAKVPVPGNDYWLDWEKTFTDDPQKFMAVDYFALQSKVIDDSFWHRWACNIAYLAVLGILRPIGKCSSIFLLPPEYKKIACVFNRFMPADR